jgi:hypothetical protein
MIRRAEEDHSSFWERLEEADRFFMGTGKVPETVRLLAADLNRERIDYAIVGGMALNAHGYRRETVDVDVLVNPDGLAAFKDRLVGRGYTERFRDASKSFLNTQTGVHVDFIAAGEYPGDGKPKPVMFPDPANASEEIEGIKVVNLPTLINLKLASGMTAPHRRRDLADVQDLIRVETLLWWAEFADRLDPYVRETYLTLLKESITTVYYPLFVHGAKPQLEEMRATHRINVLGVLTMLSVRVSQNTLESPAVIRVRINGVNCGLAVSFGPYQSGEKMDTTNSESVGPDDEVVCAVSYTGRGTLEIDRIDAILIPHPAHS